MSSVLVGERCGSSKPHPVRVIRMSEINPDQLYVADPEASVPLAESTGLMQTSVVSGGGGDSAILPASTMDDSRYGGQKGRGVG